MKNNLVLWVLGAAIAGGVIGFYSGQSQRVVPANISGAASMMKDNGSNMMQMGEMMASMGGMMWERGERYGDDEMMEKGKELEASGSMMQDGGNEMMGEGDNMMRMMREGL